MTALVLYPIALALVAVGGLLTWPVARRVGERRPDGLVWEPVGSPHSTGRRWRPQPARLTWTETVALWWAMTDPRPGRHA